MGRLTVDDLERIKQEQQKKRALGAEDKKVRVTVHMGTCGIAAGAQKIMAALKAELSDAGAKGVVIETSGCAGFCSREPMATVERAGETPVKYAQLTEEKMKTIVQEHIVGGVPVEKLALARGSESAY